MKYKLGLDLGSTSLGWAVLELNDMGEIIRLADLGVRIFPDGRDAKKHTPVNVERRNARTMRRRGDRVRQRVRATLSLLKKHGMEFKLNKENENPYALRTEALSRQLLPSELGRVLFHLALRRGFKSNRKDLKKEGGGKLKAAQDALIEKLNGKTLGAAQAAGDVSLRFSNQFDGNKIKDGALYPTRQMYIEEFNAICDAQKISDEMRKEFFDVIFFQRPLKPQDVGNCMFEPNQLRAHKFEPAFQKWRALQQLNQLAIIENGNSIPLSDTQLNFIKDILLNSFDGVNKKGKLTFAEIKKKLKAKHLIENTKIKFNLESEKRDSLDADKTGAAFLQIDAADFWRNLSSDDQSALLANINNECIEDDEIIADLIHKGISAELSEKIANINLEDGTANVSLVAINKMLPFLQAGQMYHEAAKSAGYHHSDKDIPGLDELPYYGDMNLLKPSLVCQNGIYKTTNASVHIAMNQIRAVVNELIAKHGKPTAINVEMGRDLRSGAEELKEIDKQQSANKKKNDKIREDLENIGIANPSREDFQKYKLWEALAKDPTDRKCVYTGAPITSLNELFHGNKFEIEHILPFAQTLDDSIANKTISAIEANRFKGNRTPFDAFTASDSPWNYDDVWARSQSLPDNVKWRFNKDALESYLKDNDCIARALNDTRHMSRLAALYLKHICEDKNAVAALPGKMTALFRDMWHLDWWKKKENSDVYRGHHIHHAIDAFVIAVMGRGNLQKLSTSANNMERFGKNLKEKRKELFSDITLPFDGFDYYDFMECCENTNISYRPDKKDPKASGTIGQLHEDTAYNLEEFTNGTRAKFSLRESLPEKKADAKKFYEKINRKTLEMFLREEQPSDFVYDQPEKFLDWSKEKGFKKVRTISEKDSAALIPIFRTKAERDECRKAYLDWYAQDGIATGMTDKKAKAAQKAHEAALLVAYQNAAKKAYKWFVSGNNFSAEVYAIRKDDTRYPKLRGKWQVEVISNYNAQLDGGQPVWRKKYPTARRVMSLRINDIVRAEFSRNDENLPRGIIDSVKHKCDLAKEDTIELNFRVKKLNSNGTIYLRPDWIAKEEADTKSWAASAGSLQEHKARKVYVSPVGTMTDMGFSK
jgi:CRISPR-associated endonuclease Csn1